MRRNYAVSLKLSPPEFNVCCTNATVVATIIYVVRGAIIETIQQLPPVLSKDMFLYSIVRINGAEDVLAADIVLCNVETFFMLPLTVALAAELA